MVVVRNVKYSLFLLILVLAYGCKTDPATSGDAVLDIRLPKEPEKLNPVFFPNSIAREVCQYIFLPLADFDPLTLELQPVLIKTVPEGIVVADGAHKGGYRYDFEILDEAKWDDGKPVTGEDYLFTLKAAMHPGTTASAFRSIVSKFSEVVVDPSNPKKVSVFFDEYFMLAKEACLNVEVLPKHIYDAKGILDKYKLSDFLVEAEAEKKVAADSTLISFAADINGIKFTKDIVVGCGPYQLGEWKAGEYIVIEKKNNFWAKDKKIVALQQNADKIVFHIIPDETAAYTRLKSGELDVLSGVSPSNFNQLQKDTATGFSFHTPQLMKYYNISINHKDPVMSSQKVRQALASLVDVDGFIKNFEFGNAVRTVGPVNPAKSYFNKDIKPYSFNIDGAKKLLAEDGWKDADNNGILDKTIGGKKTELAVSLLYSGDLGKNISLQIQADALKAGMKVDIEFKEFAQIRKENLETGKYTLVLQSSVQDFGNEDFSLRFHSANAEVGEGNFSFYTNAKADALIEAINEEKDNEKRKVLYKEIQQLFHETLPYIFLYSPTERIVISNRWKGSTNQKRPGYQANTFVPANQ
ncbi:MAG TPA: ABC transporter substrate-binding protein [Saprospiraceae bacterium]|nr:ABC transporter substrate-binding protein [Saprospiraceae bacterium]